MFMSAETLPVPRSHSETVGVDPELSIIMIVGEQRRRAVRALESVLDQEGLDQAEVILVDNVSPDLPALPGAQHPQVRMFRRPPPADYGTLKADAVHLARGRIVAFLEDHVTIKPGWVRAILARFGEPWIVVGGVVHNANAGIGISDTMAILNYGPWMPPFEAGEAEWVAGNNSAYLRDALLAADQPLRDLLTADVVLQFWLKQQGARFYLDPTVAIEHLNETDLPNAFRAVFFYHWCFAALRARLFGWPQWQRLAHLVMSPLIPWLRWWRLLRLAAGSGRMDQLRPLLALLLLHGAVFGQNLGLLFGARGGRRRMAAVELSTPRPRA